MANQRELEGVIRKELHVYYVLDTSGSMSGDPIGALNDAIKATKIELEEIDKTNADAKLKIGILEFNNTANWITVNSNNEPVVQDLEDLYFQDLKAGGMTALGAALKELNDKLSRNELQHSKTGNKAPVIIYMSDGGPTDPWRSELDKLKSNSWYQEAIKIAFALGDYADEGVLAEVVGTPEAVIHPNDLAQFKTMFRIASVRSALAGSVSVNPKDKKTSTDIATETKITATNPDPVGVDTPDPYQTSGLGSNIDFGDQGKFV